jgi:hypothetical protein
MSPVIINYYRILIIDLRKVRSGIGYKVEGGGWKVQLSDTFYPLPSTLYLLIVTLLVFSHLRISFKGFFQA